MIEQASYEDVSHGRRWRQRSIELGDDWEQGPSGILLPPSSAPERKRPISVDLFAGAGGFGLGFHQAGFHVAVASEADHMAAWTYLCNLGAPETMVHVLPGVADAGKKALSFHAAYEGQSMTAAKFFELRDFNGDGPGTGWIAGEGDPDGENVPEHRLACEHYYLGDVFKLTGERILGDLGMGEGDVDAVTGGPPCQGFSRAGLRNVEDPRNSLVFEFARLVLEIRPKTFVMENVPGIMSMVTPEGIPVVDALCRVLSDGGFGKYDALKRAVAAQAERALTLHQDTQSAEVVEDEDVDEPQQLGLLDAA